MTFPGFHHGRYQAGEVLGAGAQGVVFRVADREAPERPLVAKLWRPGVFGDDVLGGEFALLSRLRLPGLVRAHDLGREEQSGAPFLVEDFIDGQDAERWIHEGDSAGRGGRLSSLLVQLSVTLAALHEAGFLHGDLKPAHVRIPPGGRATLLDLGASIPRALRSEAPRAFSPGFAAPEVVAGAPPSVASELFGLGALAWTVVDHHPPAPGPRRPLRERAPWVPPAVAELIEALLREHPGDRPAHPGEIIRRLGPTATGWQGTSGRVLGREEELRALRSPWRSPVRYLTGAPGVGKSLLAGELFTRTLLAGQASRRLVFPQDGAHLLPALLAYLRGAEEAYPFGEEGRPGAPLLLVLDDLHRAPRELGDALEVFRCRRRPERLVVLAVERASPSGAEEIRLGPLSDEVLWALGQAAGAPAAQLGERVRAASGSPGWLLASLGRIPRDDEAVRRRLAACSGAARTLYGAAVALGGALEERWSRALAGEQAPGALASLLEQGLLDRRQGPAGVCHEIPGGRSGPGGLLEGRAGPGEIQGRPGEVPEGASPDEIPLERLAGILLADPEASPAALRSLARCGEGPHAGPLLTEAARRARARGQREEEIEALLALCQRPTGRTPEALCRLERLGRDAGKAGNHPQVLDWMEEAVAEHPGLGPLVLRRRAEQKARAGDAEAAAALASRAGEEARALGSLADEAYALATAGMVALFRAAWGEAHGALREARRRLAGLPTPDDPEESARLDHNLGVVAVYRGQIAEAIGAFERSLRAKERLGDRAGMRACLRNLGYALVRAGRFEEAAQALDEARSLAESLGQAAGLAWCLVARAEVEVRRGAREPAERFLAEAEALGAQIPGTVQADLLLLRAELRLLDGDGPGALASLAAIPAPLRQQDALVDASVQTLEARARLASVPASPREAARGAIAAIRRARGAGLPEAEGRALAALQEARRRAPAPLPPVPVGSHPGGHMSEEHEAALWNWLARMGSVTPGDELARELAVLVRERSGAERAFLLLVGEEGEVQRAWGADLDGLALGEVERRIPASWLEATLRQTTPLYQRSVATAGGSGSRLAQAGEAGARGSRPVVLLEHRFAVGRFDGLATALLDRWQTLLGLLGRLAPANTPASPGLPERSGQPGPPERAGRPGSPERTGQPGATTLQPRGAPRRFFPGLVGESEPWVRALVRLDTAIDSELPALIVGETGVGKELFARALHEHGPRPSAPFVAVNCAALPDALFEAELFGHARGAFTGAERARPGLLAAAEGGTLFLDEIGELSLPRQASLLRVLQERSFRPVGGDQERPLRVRVVAATNRDLDDAVAQGTFRRDLLYRLDVLRIRVPALRERPGDLRRLVEHFLERAGSTTTLAPAALAALESHHWPGNVRELEHLVQRLAALRLPRVELPHLPRELRAPATRTPAIPPPREPRLPGEPRSPGEPGEPEKSGVPGETRGLGEPEGARSPGEPGDERAETLRAMETHGGNISHAARALGLTRQGLKKRMLRLGLREPQERAGPREPPERKNEP